MLIVLLTNSLPSYLHFDISTEEGRRGGGEEGRRGGGEEGRRGGGEEGRRGGGEEGRRGGGGEVEQYLMISMVVD